MVDQQIWKFTKYEIYCKLKIHTENWNTVSVNYQMLWRFQKLRNVELHRGQNMGNTGQRRFYLYHECFSKEKEEQNISLLMLFLSDKGHMDVLHTQNYC